MQIIQTKEHRTGSKTFEPAPHGIKPGRPTIPRSRSAITKQHVPPTKVIQNLDK